MLMNQKGSTLVMGVLALAAAVGVSFMASRGFLTAKKSFRELEHSVELEAVSKSVIDYGRYILRERKLKT